MDNILQLAPAQIRPSPFNPRKHLGDLSDLANSISAVGLQQPVVVRPIPEASVLADVSHELVFGHRRHAAAQLAGLETITAIVREYSDDEVLEIQIVENSQREDVHPLDEAEGFEALIERGRSVAEVADRIGRPPAFVARRLQLLNLTPGSRQAFDEERLSIGAAMALARLPETLQNQALEELLEAAREIHWALDVDDDDEPTTSTISAKEANRLIRGKYLLRLADVPWDLADEAVADGRPDCSTCPARTGNQAHLWDDQPADLCLDPECYRAKLDASFLPRAQAQGFRPLSGEEAPAARHAYAYDPEWVRLDAKEWAPGGDDGGHERKPVSDIIHGHQVTRALAQDPETGAHVELVARADLRQIIQGASGVDGEQPDDYEAKWKAAQKREREAAKRRAVEVRLALAEAVQRIEDGWEDHFGLILRLAIRNCWSDSYQHTLARRGITEGDGKKVSDVEASVLELLDELAQGDPLGGYAKAMGLAFEVCLRRFAPSNGMHEGSDEWQAAMKALGVDLKAVKKAATAELRPKRKPRKAKPEATET